MPFGRGQGKRAFEQLADTRPVVWVDQHGIETRADNSNRTRYETLVPHEANHWRRRTATTHNARHPRATGFPMLFVSVPKVIEEDCEFLAQIRQRRRFEKPL